VPDPAGSAEGLLDSLAEEVVRRAAAKLPDFRLLNVEQAAERLGRSKQYVYALADRGEIPIVCTGKKGFLIDINDLKAWAQARKTRR